MLLRICSITVKLPFPLKIWSFKAKWRESGITSALHILKSFRWLFSLKLKPVSALPMYYLWNFLLPKRHIAKLLLQLTWSEIVNIRTFCWLRNKSLFSNCQQHRGRIRYLQGVHFPSDLFFFLCFCFLSFWMVFPTSCFKHLILLRLLRSLRSYVTASDKTWTFCVAFGVNNFFAI